MDTNKTETTVESNKPGMFSKAFAFIKDHKIGASIAGVATVVAGVGVAMYAGVIPVPFGGGDTGGES